MKRLAAVILSLTILAANAESFVARIPLSGAPDAMRANIALCADALDGTALDTGEAFSFNDIVGPRTAERGYLAAENGRGVKVTGGGVAQAASAIDLALQASGAEVDYGARSTYGARYRGTYVSDSSDAILVDYASGIDYRFTNLGEPFTLKLWIDGNELCCSVTTQTDEDFDEFAEDEAVPVLGFELPEEDRRLVCSASIPLEGDDALISNVRLAAESIDGAVVHPGEEFSFNELVGPRTAERGYLAAENGRGVRVTGGGVAQAASVVWLTAKQAEDVAVTQKETYGSRYVQSYVESSNDAILTDYKAGTDFRFRNMGERALTIRLFEEDGRLVCEMYE